MKYKNEPFTLSYEANDSFLRVFAKGRLADPENRTLAWKKIVDRCRTGHFTRLMVVQESPGNDSDLDAYSSTVKIVNLGLQGLRIAFVDPVPEHEQHNKFAELVAQNRGVRGRTFADENEARNWLLE